MQVVGASVDIAYDGEASNRGSQAISTTALPICPASVIRGRLLGSSEDPVVDVGFNESFGTS